MRCGRKGPPAATGRWRSTTDDLLDDAERRRLLNISDCRIDSPAAARSVRRHSGRVDVLFKQFSYIWWNGNPEELGRRQKAARRVLQNIAVQGEVFKPWYLVPFASHIHFGHDENVYMNDALNTIGETVDFIRVEMPACHTRGVLFRTDGSARQTMITSWF